MSRGSSPRTWPPAWSRSWPWSPPPRQRSRTPARRRRRATGTRRRRCRPETRHGYPGREGWPGQGTGRLSRPCARRAARWRGRRFTREGLMHHFDEMAKALAVGLTRRQALQRVGGGLAGALLASLGLGKAWGAGGPQTCSDYCKTTLGLTGHAASQCVTNCKKCIPSGGTACGADNCCSNSPSPGPKCFLNGTSGSCCSRDASFPSSNSTCAATQCVCTMDLYGAQVCWYTGGDYKTCSPCNSTAPCPDGWACVPDSSCSDTSYQACVPTC